MKHLDDELIHDITLGFIHSTIMAISLSIGLVIGGFSNESIVLVLIAKAIAGSISIGLTNYLSLEGHEHQNISAIRTTLGYFCGIIMTMIAFHYTQNSLNGIKLALILNFLALIGFGYYRSRFLNKSIFKSVNKIIAICAIAIAVTFFISSSDKN